MTPIKHITRSRWPHVGEIWEEVHHRTAEMRFRKVLSVDDTRVMFEDEQGRVRSVKTMSFINWARVYAEIRESTIQFPKIGLDKR